MGKSSEVIFSNGVLQRIEGSLPGSLGIRVSRTLSPDEMILLTKMYDMREFGLAQEKLTETEFGDYWLFSGELSPDGAAYIYIPEQIHGIDLIAIYHTHPNGSAIPSLGDISELEWRHSIGIQDKSGIIPLEADPARVVYYYPYTKPDDYAPGKKHYQPRQS